MKKTILENCKKVVLAIIALALFCALMYQALWMMANPVMARDVAEVDDWFLPDEAAAEGVLWTSESDSVMDISNVDIDAFLLQIASVEPQVHADTLYMDSNGATAYGWELNEAIRLVMLESGAESDIDIREHCALLCKQLLYTQTVGGWDDWGVTLSGIIHSDHTYIQTSPRIWTVDGAPTERVIKIFWDVWFNGYFSDFRVQCFRSTCYHTWAIPAYQIDKTYYSINPWQDFSMFNLDENGLLMDILE